MDARRVDARLERRRDTRSSDGAVRRMAVLVRVVDHVRRAQVLARAQQRVTDEMHQRERRQPERDLREDEPDLRERRVRQRALGIRLHARTSPPHRTRWPRRPHADDPRHGRDLDHGPHAQQRYSPA